MTSKRVRITGRVQGVSYRAWTQDTARALGLDGWARNRADGSVEAMFAGDADAVDRILAACRQGPPAAQVENIEILAEGEPVKPGFPVRPTV